MNHKNSLEARGQLVYSADLDLVDEQACSDEGSKPKEQELLVPLVAAPPKLLS